MDRTQNAPKVITEYFPEYPDDPRVKRIIHVHEDGSETVVYDIAEATHG